MTNNELTTKDPRDDYEASRPKQIQITEVANGYIVKPKENSTASELLVFPTMEKLVEWVQEWGE